MTEIGVKDTEARLIKVGAYDEALYTGSKRKMLQLPVFFFFFATRLGKTAV